MAEYRIDELARLAGTTTRNVRAYQDRGILPPPRREGRVGIYTDAHLARLRLIGSLLRRGYASAQISELLSGWEQGKNLGEVLGLEEAINSPWTDEIPAYLPTDQVRELLGGDEQFDRVVRLGLLEPDGERCLVTSPQLLSGFTELTGSGFSIGELIELYEDIAPAVDVVARRMVEAGASRLIAEHGDAWLPEKDEVAEVTQLLRQLRLVAMSSVQGILGHALERNIESVLGEHLARVIKQNQPRE
ncbi:MerR family transcriptional regulator [Amycolatopsis nigrescens]|uniref:MerR family transcriptional regulator n=1 Tax=Amycolatopsis nigrescens TaxID=381445 RepID=UPI000362EFF4|nr:MerR family transcriptional regulator [Amycolatopsis nigrescens]